jgi:hypothetical protein
LCGIESVAEAMRPAAIVGHGRCFSPEHIMLAMRSLPSLQKLNVAKRAVHAAAFWNATGGIVAVCEDVGRHNALDKLSGTLARSCIGAGEGMILLTSRVSVEMVQKGAAIGAPMMVSVSAPTALAVRMADAAGITLAAIARADGSRCSRIPIELHLTLLLVSLPVARRGELVRPDAIVTLCDLRKRTPTLSHAEAHGRAAIADTSASDHRNNF